jgi:Transglutaminase-like superfamily
VSELARNVVVHYRASGETLPETSALDINLRWLEDILETDQGRHPAPLAAPRAATERVQGCCRDHTLFSVGALRQQGIPARSRIGFASYFSPSWHQDHVIVEAWLGGRWVRFDPEVDRPLSTLPDPTDIPSGPPPRCG